MQRNPCVSIGIFSGLIVLCTSYWMLVWAVSPLITLNPPSRLSFTGFATSLAIVGDVDVDSTPDYLIGAYQQGLNNKDVAFEDFYVVGISFCDLYEDKFIFELTADVFKTHESSF